MSNADKDRRTHAPTPKRIADFRKRGEIALSRDLSAVAAMAGAAFCTFGYATFSGNGVSALMHGAMNSVDGRDLGGVLHASGQALVAASLPAALGALGGWLLSATLQLGWPPALSPIKFDPSRTFTLGGLGPLFSPKAAGGRALKALAKVAFVGFACAIAISDERRRFLSHPALEPRLVGAHMLEAASRLATRAGVPLAALAALDYFIQRRSLMAKMRMTSDEMRREYKDQEGDPLIKRARRRRMRELAKRRLALSVQSADVVLVNPTEYAVALRYNQKEDRAPRVVAKGRGELAERIREIARSAGVPIVPQPPLARLLHATVAEGREIPSNLYHAVAEVLAYIYRLRRRG